MLQAADQNLPVIIFAQSGRFLAESLTEAGYRVSVLDCFGDTDTLAVADKWQRMPQINMPDCQTIVNRLSQMADNKKCALIYDSGIEGCYPLLAMLPDNIVLIGNNADTVKLLKTPHLFFQLLDTLNIAYPATQFTLPDTKNWLAKKATGFGGQHIRYLTADLRLSKYYFQSYIAGASGSCLFLANGKQVHLISINRHTTKTSGNMPLRLSAISGPWSLCKNYCQQLERIMTAITSHAHLVGLNSIDFIIAETGQLLVLEINPRPSASAQLIKTDTPLLQHHIHACQGILPKNAIYKRDKPSSLHYLFATKGTTIPTGMTWPADCHDLPAGGTIINKDDPICTIVINDSARLTYEIIVNKINQKLYT